MGGIYRLQRDWKQFPFGPLLWDTDSLEGHTHPYTLLYTSSGSITLKIGLLATPLPWFDLVKERFSKSLCVCVCTVFVCDLTRNTMLTWEYLVLHCLNCCSSPLVLAMCPFNNHCLQFTMAPALAIPMCIPVLLSVLADQLPDIAGLLTTPLP